MTRKMLGLSVSAVLACCLTGVVGIPASSAASTSGAQTSVPVAAGHGVGSGAWGVVGDIESRAGTSATYTYGIAFNPTNDSLVVSDSGKMFWRSQIGTPRVFRYANVGGAAGTNEQNLTTYAGNGTYSQSVSAAGSLGVNAGIGAKYQSIADRTTYIYPAPTTGHGPRGIAFAPNGTIFVVDSEASAPLGGAPGAISLFDDGLNLIGGAGFTATWDKRKESGVHFYRTGAAATPQGTILVNSEVSDRLQEYGAAGNFIRSIELDLPANGSDRGFRNPYSIAVDPIDGSLYVPLVIFRDDPGWKTQPPFLEKRDATGAAILAQFAEPSMPKGEVVMGAAVEPRTQHVFTWFEFTAGIWEFDKNGVFIKKYTPTEFPGLFRVRGMAFDKNGRMYITVAEGTTNTRIMILGKTPDPVTAPCGSWNSDKTSLTINYACGSVPGTLYQQTPVVDFVVESSSDGGATWNVVPTPTSAALHETVTGVTPGSTLRVSAWNEAGNGDWATVTIPDGNAAPDTATTQASTPVTLSPLANDGGERDAGSLQLQSPDGSYSTTLTTPEGRYEVTGTAISFTPVAGFIGTTPAVAYVARQEGCPIASTLTVSVTPAPAPTPTPTPTPEPTSTPTPTPTPAQITAQLPATGGPAFALIVFAAVCITSGAGILRRR